MEWSSAIGMIRGMPPVSMGWLAASAIGIGAIAGLPDAALLATSVGAAAQAALLEMGDLTYANCRLWTAAKGIRGAGAIVAAMSCVDAIPYGGWIIGSVFLAFVAFIFLSALARTLAAAADWIAALRMGGG